jgi:CheY-like chemotaxis protein
MNETCSVAIVDDDPPVLKAVRRFLCGRGFETRTYESGREFLDALPEARPDCLVVDLQMPGMTGLELHQHLRRKGVDIPTIAISAHAGEDARERCVAAGVRTLLAKPLQPNELIAAIRALPG